MTTCGIDKDLQDMPIQFARGDEFNITLTIDDFLKDSFGNIIEGSETRADLENAVITHFVTDAAGNVLLTKVSTIVSELEINPDQVSPLTKGTAVIKYVEEDTAALDVAVERWHYTRCVFNDGTGRELRVVKRSLFLLNL